MNPLKTAIIFFIVLLIVVTTVFAFFSSVSAARDEIRVKNLQLITQYLQGYKENQGSYPIANAFHQPQGWEDYLEALPEFPTGGGCSESNIFEYNQLNQGQSYRITFCLENSSSGFMSGFNTITS